MPEQPPIQDVLNGLADQGELVLLQMQPGLRIDQEMLIAQIAVQWAELATAIALLTLGSANAAKLRSTSRTASPTHPRPTAISVNLADYWDSVAWRIDQLREWAANPPE